MPSWCLLSKPSPFWGLRASWSRVGTPSNESMWLRAHRFNVSIQLFATLTSPELRQAPFLIHFRSPARHALLDRSSLDRVLQPTRIIRMGYCVVADRLPLPIVALLLCSLLRALFSLLGAGRRVRDTFLLAALGAVRY